MSHGFGGLALYVFKVANFLKENRLQYQVLGRKSAFLSQKLTESGIVHDVLHAPFHHLPLFTAFRVARYIDRHKIDVMHVHWAKDLFLAVLAKKLARRPVKLVFTRQMAISRKKSDAYHRFLYRNIDAYLVITENLADEARRFLPLSAEKIQVLYYGVPEAVKHPECTTFLQQAGLSGDVFRLAIFGRVEHIKGQHLVVQAVEQLVQQGDKVQLAIIGHVMDQDYFSQLQQEIEAKGLQQSVFYLGFHDNPTSIMPCFDAIVLATECETFGLVLAEAMRAGVAVVGSDCGGVPEIIAHEKTGLLFASGNADDLAQQLQKLVSDERWRLQLAAAGKADADKRFSEQQHFARLQHVFRAVLDQARP